MSDALRRSPVSGSRPPATPALLGFAAAFVLTQAADQALVLVVAHSRSGGQQGRLADEAASFVQSTAGMSAVPVLNGMLLVALAAALATLQTVRSGGTPAGRLRLRPQVGSGLRGAIATTAGLLGLSVACGAGIDLLGVSPGSTMDVMQSAFRSPSPAQLALAAAAIGVVPGVAEEVFFRGFLLESLSASWGLWPGIIASAAAFGLIHVDPVQVGAAFVAGVFLAWSARRLGSIRPTIVAHAVNNVAFLVLAASGLEGGPSPTRNVGALCAGALLCAASAWWMPSGAGRSAEVNGVSP